MESKILNITKKATLNEIIDKSLSIIDRLNKNLPVSNEEIMFQIKQMQMKLADESKSLKQKIDELKKENNLN